MIDTGAMLSQAYTLHQQGRLQEAVALYQQVVKTEPRNGDALHLLGLAMAGLGQLEAAVRMLSAAVQVQPANAAFQTNLAMALSGAGRFAEAIPCYQRAVALQPGLAAAQRGLGVAQMQLGQLQAALVSFDTAVRLAPADDAALNGLGVVQERLGRVEEARQSLNQALALNPNNVEAHHNLALLEAAAGRHSQALASLDRALSLQPDNAVLRSNQAVQLLALGRATEALASFDRALAIRPNDAITHHNRGLTLVHLGREADAIASFDRALQLTPDLAQAHLWRAKALIKLDRAADALASLDRSLQAAPQSFDAHFQRGRALALLERDAEAISAFEEAIALDKTSAEAFNNRGALLVRLGQSNEALADFTYAARLNPNYADAHTNAGNTLRGLGRYDEALRSLDRALAMKPDDLTAQWTKALVKLAKGDLREGWPLYESRLRRETRGQLPRTLQAPRWTGEQPLAGKTLFVHAEQGLGDTLQFCRYIPVLEAMGAQVVFEIQPVLRKLLGSLATQATLISRGEPIPRHDLQIPLLSVPLALNTDLQTIPRDIPYLRADSEALATWKQRLRELPGMKVGIHWHGNPEAERLSAFEARSFPLAAAAPLARLEGITLVSLQKGDGAEQREQVEFSRQVAQLTDPLYMGADEIATETAALLSAVDVVITADTALAHLAGALGARTWLVLQAVPDWRWLIDRDDSPWYPTMRLFRQRRSGDWGAVFDRVATELHAQRARVGGANE